MAEDQNRTFTDKFMLRLPDGMRDRIKEAAAKGGRSMNSEIVARLEESFSPDTTEGTVDGITFSVPTRKETADDDLRTAEGVVRIFNFLTNALASDQANDDLAAALREIASGALSPPATLDPKRRAVELEEQEPLEVPAAKKPPRAIDPD